MNERQRRHEVYDNGVLVGTEIIEVSQAQVDLEKRIGRLQAAAAKLQRSEPLNSRERDQLVDDLIVQLFGSPM